MEIFFSESAPSLFPLFSHAGKNLTAVSVVLTVTSASKFQLSSCSDRKARALDMQLGYPDFFLLSGDLLLLFFLICIRQIRTFLISPFGFAKLASLPDVGLLLFLLLLFS